MRNYRDPSFSPAKLERHLRVWVECVGEREPVVAVRDVCLCHENRRQLLPTQHLFQVFQHARIGQRYRDAAGGLLVGLGGATLVAGGILFAVGNTAGAYDSYGAS